MRVKPKSTRRLVETVIDQLTDRFNTEKARARKLWYLTNRIARKVLAHTICVLINKQQGNHKLQFELLLKDKKLRMPLNYYLNNGFISMAGTAALSK